MASAVNRRPTPSATRPDVPDLFGILSSTARSLEAQRMGLDVTGQNIANVNTPGYSRRVVDIAAVPPPTRQQAGGGAEVQGIRAQRDRLVERRLGLETSGAQRYATMADELGMVESALGTGTSSLDTRLNDFFDSQPELFELKKGDNGQILGAGKVLFQMTPTDSLPETVDQGQTQALKALQLAMYAIGSRVWDR